MIKNERIVTTQYYDLLEGLIAGSDCAGCPVMKDQFLTPALLLDHGINRATASYASELPTIALQSVISPEDVPEHRRDELKDIVTDFTKMFRQTPEQVVKKSKPRITKDNLGTAVVELLNALPEKNKKAADRLVKKLDERLNACPNTEKKSLDSCAVK